MPRLKLIIVSLAATAVMIGASVGVASLVDSHDARPAAAASGQMPRSTQPTADTQIAYWVQRTRGHPDAYLEYTLLGQAFLRKARESGDIGYYQRAEAAARKALEISPRWVQASALLSSVLFSVHDFRGALQIAEPISAHLSGASALATVGDAHLALGEYTRAESAYDELGRLAPNLPAVLSRLANLADLHGYRDDARQLMRQAAKLAGDSDETEESRAWYQFQLGELDFRSGLLLSAGLRYNAALRAFPNYYLALAGLGKVRAAQGDYATAIGLYRRATEIVPQPELLAALGDLYTVTGNTRAAEEQYATVEFIGKLAKINRQVYNRQLANFYSDHNRHLPEALRLAMDELKVRKDVFGYDAAAWASYKNGLLPQAEELSAQALGLGTRDAKLLYHAGMIASALGRPDDARRLLTAALALNPHFDLLQAPVARAALAQLEA